MRSPMGVDHQPGILARGNNENTVFPSIIRNAVILSLREDGGGGNKGQTGSEELFKQRNRSHTRTSNELTDRKDARGRNDGGAIRGKHASGEEAYGKERGQSEEGTVSATWRSLARGMWSESLLKKGEYT